MATTDDLLRAQAGVISRRQALASGLRPHDLRRLLRRREWVVVHPGVYADHTGPLSWTQRAWAAVLAAWPAALCHESALRAVLPPQQRDRPDGSRIHVAVGRKRVVSPPPGVEVHPLAAFPTAFLAHTAPPRQRVEEALIDLAAAARDDLSAVAVLADAVQARRTTGPRLSTALAGRRRVRRRSLLASLIDDISAGTTSALEHAYLQRVVRAHGLPTGRLQSDDRGMIRDVEHPDLGLIVELDGRLFHAGAEAWDADRERDLDATLCSDAITLRLSWGQVVGRSCSTADKVARLMRRRGWSGELISCPRCPPLGPARQRRDSLPPGDTQPRRSA